MRKKDVNIRFIAEKCGVSTATVSRVLNEDSRVAKNTRQKVLDALETYGYGLSDAARSKVPKVGVILRINNPDYNTGLLRSISDYFFARSIQVIVCNAERITPGSLKHWTRFTIPALWGLFSSAALTWRSKNF